MQTIQISDQVADQLSEIAAEKNISTSTLIGQLITNQVTEKQPVLLTDLISKLPTINAFKGSPLETQQAMRNEWD